MSKLVDAVSLEYLPGKFAEKHLDECTHIECDFCGDQQCCFGMRDVGCPRLDPEVLHKTEHVSSVVLAAHKAGLYDPSDIRAIIKGTTEMIVPIKEKVTQKSFSFVFEGVEFTTREHASDQTSCPHCFADHHDVRHPERHRGFLGYKKLNDEKCAACFRCTKCFKTFFYHVNRSWVEKWQ